MQSVNCIYAIASLYFILAAIQSAYILRRHAALKKRQRECSEVQAGSHDPISVVVFADSANSDCLEKSIPAIMEQNHPDFETIVVNSDSSASTDDILTRLTTRYPGLHSTFIPATSCNVSVRKLSATLGIKAAKHEIVVLTDADCIPQSGEWLNRMSRHFADEATGLVIGYCHYRYANDTTSGHRYRAYDTVATDSHYLSSAIRGHAFRGDRRNIAIRKQLFFDNKGFSGTMNLKYGDDDIFVKELSRVTNVAVELSAEGMLEADYSNPADHYDSDKTHRAFTLDRIKPAASLPASIMTTARYIFLILSILLTGYASYSYLTNPAQWQFPAIIAGYSLFVYIVETIIFITATRKIAMTLQAVKQFFTVPVFRFVRPFVNLYFRAKSKHTDNYTWE